MIKVLALLFSLLGSHSFAQTSGAEPAFSFKHGDCSTRVPEKDHFLQELFLEIMKERGYKPKLVNKASPLRAGELYMSFRQTLPSGWPYKNCLVQISLKSAKIDGGSKDDEVLYQHQVKREFPRVTFTGKERCRRALKDSFVHIPYCLTPKAP